MQSIELIALKHYESNLNYLSQKHPGLFKKLQIFDIAQEREQFKPNYDLEYKDTYFDVKNIQDNSYLYNTDSNAYANKIANDIDYKKTSSLFNGLIDYKISPENIKKLTTIDKMSGSNLKDILPIMNYAMKVAPRSTTMKVIDKFIFVGVGLGTHISMVDKKIHSTEYLIIEDNLEIFRLSLFVTPYYELAQTANLHLAVSQNETDFTFSMVNFLEGSFFNNRFIKYTYFAPHSNLKLKLIQNNLASQNYMTFPYDIYLQKLLRPLKRIKDKYKTINISSKFPESIISQKPVIILAAGPSFKKNISFLKKNKNKYIIIAVTAVLKVLSENNIRPDIVTHIDGIEAEGNSCMVHFENLETNNFLKDTMFIFGSHTPDSVLSLFKKKNIFFFETATFYFNDFGSLSTPCIGSTAVVLGLWLNAKNIYLLGLDLALDQETGATHSGEHSYNKLHNLKDSEKIDYTISLRNNLIPIKGNFRETVLTTPLFHISVRSLFSNLSIFKDKDQTIYNLNDGAYLETTIPKKIESINLDSHSIIDKNILSTTLYNILNQRARDTFNEDELKSLQIRLNYAQNILKSIQEYKIKTFTDEQKYLYDLLGLVSDILKVNGREGDNLSVIFSFYFQYSLPYIMDIVNTKEITKVMKHMKNIDKMFIEGCTNIIQAYIKGIKVFL